MLKYFYITNNPAVAKIAEQAGVDRIFVDMEYIGKELRQPNMDTVKNHHTIEDVKVIRNAVSKSKLLVRVNPIYSNSEKEIDEVINAGADYIMLPMWKSPQDVKQFLSFVGSRAKTILLLENQEAYDCIDDVLKIKGIDEIHIGLNDLHLSQNKRFLFELVTDGTVDYLAEKIKKAKIPFGFGGVGRVNSINAPLPAENVIAEHYRLSSEMVILSRAFCNSETISDYKEFEQAFLKGINENREYEKYVSGKGSEFFDKMHIQTKEIISKIVESK